MKRGGTINVVIWYKQTSKDLMLVGAFDVGVGGPRISDRDFTVSWLNPWTGRWQAGTNLGDDNSRLDVPPGRADLVVKPGYIAHVDLRITFSRNAPTGAVSIIPQGIGFYQLFTSSGRIDNRLLAVDDEVYQTVIRG